MTLIEKTTRRAERPAGQLLGRLVPKITAPGRGPEVRGLHVRVPKGLLPLLHEIPERQGRLRSLQQELPYRVRLPTLLK